MADTSGLRRLVLRESIEMNGKVLEAGDDVFVDEMRAEALINAGVAEDPTKKKKPRKKSKSGD